MSVEFHDFSVQVKTELNEETIAWLLEAAGEVEAHAKRNCSSDGWTKSEKKQLQGGYKYVVDEEKGIAKIGNTQEMAFWEEFGKSSCAELKLGKIG